MFRIHPINEPTKIYYVYVNGFWEGFVERRNGFHVGFFENLLKQTKLTHVEFTKDIHKANILLESHFGKTLVTAKKWEKTIFFSGEASFRFIMPSPLHTYDIVLRSSDNKENTINLPLCVVYITNNYLLPKLSLTKQITSVPSKFCCFSVSNPHCFARNKIFDVIDCYKKVDSVGKHKNNVGYTIRHPFWTKEYIQFLSQYKFIICFENTKENTYVTEKIVNVYLANSIPIYWGSDYVKQLFNKETMICLEDENNEECYYDILNKMIELDIDNNKYLEFVNRRKFNSDFFRQHLSVEKIAQQIDKFIE